MIIHNIGSVFVRNIQTVNRQRGSVPKTMNDFAMGKFFTQLFFNFGDNVFQICIGNLTAGTGADLNDKHWVNVG